MTRRERRCPACKGLLENTPSFAFPELPESWPFSHLQGPVHVECLRDHPEVAFVREVLRAALSQYASANPRAIWRGSVGDSHLIEYPWFREFEVWDLDDFAEFPLAYPRVRSVLNLASGDTVPTVRAVGSRLSSHDDGLVLQMADRWSLELSALSSQQLTELIGPAWFRPGRVLSRLSTPAFIERGGYDVAVDGGAIAKAMVAGIIPGRAWVKFTRSEVPPPKPGTLLTIRAAGSDASWSGYVLESDGARSPYQDDESGIRHRTATG